MAPAIGQIKSLPDQIVQFDSQTRRPDVAGRRHLDMFAGVERERAEDAADGLREASAGILRGGGRIGKTAAPGRCPAQRMRGEAVDDECRERCGDRDEQKHQQAIVGTAAFGNRYDRKPGLVGLHRHAACRELRA